MTRPTLAPSQFIPHNPVSPHAGRSRARSHSNAKALIAFLIVVGVLWLKLTAWR